MSKYALLFSGGINKASNYTRYSNDIGFFYRMLVEKKGYNATDISVLYADGSPINYGSVNISTRPGTLALLNEQLQKYSNTLNQDDQLIIMITNHGDLDKFGNAYLCLWGRDMLPLTRFASLLNCIKCMKVVVLGQCFGGNLLEYDIKKSILISGNEKNEVTYGHLEKDISGNLKVDNNEYVMNYDEFLYHFTSFFNGEYPDGTPLSVNTTRLSNLFVDACEFSRDNNFFKLNKIKYNGKMISEVPQIKGNDCDLSMVEI